MSETQGSTTTYDIDGDAIAIGEDTFTQVDSNAKIVNNKAVTVAKIHITAKAYAQSPEGETTYTSAYTDVNTDADITILHNFLEGSATIDGQSYDVSKTKVIAITLPQHVNLPGGSISKVKVIENDSDLENLDLNGNVALVSFNGEVQGENTLLSASVYTLAIEDTLSVSALEVTAAVS